MGFTVGESHDALFPPIMGLGGIGPGSLFIILQLVAGLLHRSLYLAGDSTRQCPSTSKEKDTIGLGL